MGLRNFARNHLSPYAPVYPPQTPRPRTHEPHARRGPTVGYVRPSPEALRVIAHYQAELAKIVALLDQRLADFDRDPTEYAPTLEIRVLRERLGEALENYFGAAGSRETQSISGVMDAIHRIDVRLLSLDEEVRAEIARFESTAEFIANRFSPELPVGDRVQYAADANEALLELFLYRTSWQKAMQADAKARLDHVEIVLRSICDSVPASVASPPLPISVVDDETLPLDSSSDSSSCGTYVSYRRQENARRQQPGRSTEVGGGQGTISVGECRCRSRRESQGFVDSNPVASPHELAATPRSADSSRLSQARPSRGDGGRETVTNREGAKSSKPRKKRSKDLLRRRRTKEVDEPERGSAGKPNVPSPRLGDRAREPDSVVSDSGGSHVSHFTLYPEGMVDESSLGGGNVGNVCNTCGAVTDRRGSTDSEEGQHPIPVMSRSRTLRDKVVLARNDSGRLADDLIEVGASVDGEAVRLQASLPGSSGSVDTVHNSPSKSFASMLYATQNVRSETFADTGMCFRAVTVRGDGRCLFRSVARARDMARGRSSMSERAERERADELRARTVQELKKHQNLLAQFYVIETDFAKYTKRMSNPKTFGGEPELLMLAKILHTPIAVYVLLEERRFKQIQVYGRQYKGDPYRILYRDGVHYDALRVVSSS